MKISSSFNNNDRAPVYQSFRGVPPNPKYIPETVGNIAKKAGHYISIPEQKLIMATTALMLVPLIDLKFAEEDKKIDSAIKSASKAIAGGITGVSIRAACISLTQNLIGFNKDNKFSLHFIPDKLVKKYKEGNPSAKIELSQFNQTLGTLMAILIMVLITNKNIDVPLTSDLQDLISGVVKDKKSWLQSFSDVKDARADKIKAWGAKWKNRLSSVSRKTKQITDILGPENKKPKEPDKQ